MCGLGRVPLCFRIQGIINMHRFHSSTEWPVTCTYSFPVFPSDMSAMPLIPPHFTPPQIVPRFVPLQYIPLSHPNKYRVLSPNKYRVYIAFTTQQRVPLLYPNGSYRLHSPVTRPAFTPPQFIPHAAPALSLLMQCASCSLHNSLHNS